MNLLDIRTRNWSEICLEATAPHLDRLLGAPLPSTAVLVRLVHAGLVRLFIHGEQSDVCLLLVELRFKLSAPLCRRRVPSPLTLCIDMVSLRAAEWWLSLETTQVQYKDTVSSGPQPVEILSLSLMKINNSSYVKASDLFLWTSFGEMTSLQQVRTGKQ